MGDLTQRRWEEIEKEYLQQQLKINKRLQEAIDKNDREKLKEELKKIQDENKWNNLSLFLRRYVHEHLQPQKYTADDGQEKYVVTHKKEDYIISDSSCDTIISKEEQEVYAKLLFAIARENECFKQHANMLFRKKDEIKKGEASISYGDCISMDYFRKFMDPARPNNLQRETMLKLSMGLKFSVEDMRKLSDAVGYSPIYNFRDAKECIIYFCHKVKSSNSTKIANEMYKKYLDGIKEKDNKIEMCDIKTKKLGNELDQIIERTYSGEEEKRKVYIDYLISKHDFFTGFSETARTLLILELFYIEKKQLSSIEDFNPEKEVRKTQYKTNEISRSTYQVELSTIRKNFQEQMFNNIDRYLLDIDEHNNLNRVNLEYIIGRDEDAEKNVVFVAEGINYYRNNSNVLNRNYRGELIYEQVTGFQKSKKIFENLDEKLKENILDGSRLRGVLFEDGSKTKELISKKDFLVLRFYKLCKMIEAFERKDEFLSEADHEKIWQFFRNSTDNILQKAGLPVIYPANPFENLILTALCTENPSMFIQKVFEYSYEESVETDKKKRVLHELKLGRENEKNGKIKLAKKHYRKAADYDKRGEFQYGVMCMTKEGSKQPDYEEARKVFKKLINKDVPKLIKGKAYGYLGRIYEDGLGVETDIEKAAYYYSRAQKCGAKITDEILQRINDKLLKQKQ